MYYRKENEAEILSDKKTAEKGLIYGDEFRTKSISSDFSEYQSRLESILIRCESCLTRSLETVSRLEDFLQKLKDSLESH
ncbi:MAG: hypothetical protein LBT04_02930 [Prevotellaceae bacterium]|jgi:hypothetical protein|nr:hypothetical protein [Prevotellaceae bacterium]